MKRALDKIKRWDKNGRYKPLIFTVDPAIARDLKMAISGKYYFSYSYKGPCPSSIVAEFKITGKVLV